MIIDHRREDEQPQEAPVPPAVENVTRAQKEEILPAVTQPGINRQHDREEEQESERIENHGAAGRAAGSRHESASLSTSGARDKSNARLSSRLHRRARPPARAGAPAVLRVSSEQ